MMRNTIAIAALVAATSPVSVSVDYGTPVTTPRAPSPGPPVRGWSGGMSMAELARRSRQNRRRAQTHRHKRR
jgi:hypothetical protein